FIGVFQRVRELLPGCDRGLRREPRDKGAVLAEQLVDRGGDVLRPDRSVARQTREIEQRIDGFFRVQLAISPAEITDFAPPTQGLPRPAELRSADITVFSSNIAIVIGPTPPGTGVMHEAVPSTLWKSTSPASLPSASRVIPTSMTTAPGFTIWAVTSLGLPAATTRMSAWRVIAPRSGVLELQMVTVAPLCKSRSAIGLPTMLLRPTTTACRPCTSISSRSISLITPRGVQGTKRGLPSVSRPMLIG